MTKTEKIDRNSEMKKLREEGWSYNELARKFEVSPTRIMQIIKRNNDR